MGSIVYDKAWVMKEFKATEKQVDKWMENKTLLFSVRQGHKIVFSKRQVKRLYRLLGDKSKHRPKKLTFQKLEPTVIEAPAEAKAAIQDAIVK